MYFTGSPVFVEEQGSLASGRLARWFMRSASAAEIGGPPGHCGTAVHCGGVHAMLPIASSHWLMRALDQAVWVAMLRELSGLNALGHGLTEVRDHGV